MRKELLQIVPMLPPAVSGVGDYALLLARELAATYNVQTRFLNGDPGWRNHQESVDGFKAEVVSERSAGAMLQALERASSCQAVLLHYVGYGYARRGCPFWLVRAIEKWKRRTGRRLIVLFHEISGTGPIWTSGFWTSGVQAWLTKRLLRLPGAHRTTSEAAAKRLRSMLPGGAAAVRGISAISTLGEPALQIPYGERRRQMVVFGGAALRKAVYTRHLPEFTEICRRLRIERVIDMSAPIGVRPTLPVPFVEAGILAAPEASHLIGQSTTGFFTYPSLFAGKSTIFAAYCAHGVTPVTVAANHQVGDDGLRPNEHFVAGIPPGTFDENMLAEVAANAHAWYQQHGLKTHVSEVYQTAFGP